MKFIHTADWHLGQTFFGFDRKIEHLAFLKWLSDTIADKQIDVLLISGDIFDSPNPSAESQTMYYRFLSEITKKMPDLQVIVISGNHDSAARLEAPNPLFELMNISVRGLVKRDADGNIDFNHFIIPLTKGGCCLAVPYLRQGDYPESDTYANGVQRMYSEVFSIARTMYSPVIAMGHLQATGSEILQYDRSERTVIGGLECISPDSFSLDIAYTALGHLHRSQRVSKRDNVRYSGAPLPMSFTEVNNKQGVNYIELINGSCSIEQIKFDTPVKLMRLSKEPIPLADALLLIENLPDGEQTIYSPYLEIQILLAEPEPSLRYKIEESLKLKAVRLARVAAVLPEQSSDSEVVGVKELHSIDSFDLANSIYKRRFGGNDMPEAMKGLFYEVVREVQNSQ